jgi:non-canonical poly(A) RNA polymerase PAPD5/7
MKPPTDFIVISDNEDDGNDDAVEIHIDTTKQQQKYQLPTILEPMQIPTQFGLPSWLVTANTRGKRCASNNIMHKLAHEIRAFADYIQPEPHEHIIRQWLIGRVRHEIHALFGSPPSLKSTVNDSWADLVVVGSFTYQLYLPNGDIDATVIHSPGFKWSEDQMMDRVAAMLVEKRLAERKFVTVLKSARIPIIKFTEKSSGLAMDISFAKQSGISSSEFLQGHLEHPRYGQACRDFIMLIKAYLVQRGLNEPFTGGLSSYALACMVVSLFQCHRDLQKYSELDPNAILGPLFIDFLNVYGNHFKYDTYGIDVSEEVGYFYRHEHDGAPVHIRDPADAKNNVTRSARQFNLVQDAFREAFLSAY